MFTNARRSIIMWLAWTASMAASWAATGALSELSQDLNSSLGLVLVASGQWLVLRRWIHGGGLWVLVSYIAGFAGSMFGALALAWLGDPLARIGAGWTLILWGIQGLTIGLAQAYLLRRIASGWGWWIVATALGFALGAPLLEPLRTTTLLGGGRTLGYLVFGLISGAVTGLAAAWFFQEDHLRHDRS